VSEIARCHRHNQVVASPPIRLLVAPMRASRNTVRCTEREYETCQGRGRAVVCELNLKLELISLDRFVTNRAGLTQALPAPHTVGGGVLAVF